MSRREKALVAILIPILIVTILKYAHPLSYDILSGYMVAVALVFKSSILSIWFASKLKIIAFLKGLTFVQGISLAIKRWFIDNVITKWLKRNIFTHFVPALKETKEYYAAISWKVKLKNALLFILPLSIVMWIMYATKMLSHFALYAELKVLISSFFKAIWLLVAKFFSFFTLFGSWIAGSWLAPILEVFALSYLLSWIEKMLGEKNPITRFFNAIGNLLNTILARIGLLNEKHLDPIVQKTFVQNSKRVGNKISSIIKEKKISEEFLYFDNFQNIILKGHINAYHSFKGMEKITNKKQLYTIINNQTKDNIDIVAYISRDKKGILLEEHVLDTFYHDIFILKGIASNPHHGVKEALKEQIDHTDFWVLNTSRFPVQIHSQNKNFTSVYLSGQSITLIKADKQFPYHDDVYCAYLDAKVYATSL
jgi:hypothetical protein